MRVTQQERVQQQVRGFDTKPDAGFVSFAVVNALLDVSESTGRRMVARGDLPAPIRLGPNRVAFRVGDLRLALAAMGRGITPTGNSTADDAAAPANAALGQA